MSESAMEAGGKSLYELLGLEKGAKEIEIRRAFRNLVTRAHPDKGGDANKFREIQQAYEVLSDPAKKEHYDRTGDIIRSTEEEFVDLFAGGVYRDHGKNVQAPASASLHEQITLRQQPANLSHSAGFEAWMRSRGAQGVQVYTSDDVIDQYGVAAGSYDPIPLPAIKAHAVRCTDRRPPRREGEDRSLKPLLSLSAEALPAGLEWGQVLVSMRYAPVNPADTYSIASGGVYGGERVDAPFVPGHDGVGVVAKCGPGVRDLQEGDWVVPAKAFLGTWRSLLVCRGRDLLRIPRECMPMERAALLREMLTAYRLLEDAQGLKPGDAVVLNAATSAVGQLTIQLASMLRLRVVAVVTPEDGVNDEDEEGEEGEEIGTAGAVEEDVARRAAPGDGTAAVRASGDDSENASPLKTPARPSLEPPSPGVSLKTHRWLRGLGASHVLADTGSLRARLEAVRFFARPKVALDAVGGASASRLADALTDGGEVLVYGCLGGRAPAWSWQTWVFRGIRVRGLNTRAWMADHPTRAAGAIEALAKLCRADKLRVEHTEYELGTEFDEAFEHAEERGRRTKIVLKVSDVGVQY